MTNKNEEAQKVRPEIIGVTCATQEYEFLRSTMESNDNYLPL